MLDEYVDLVRRVQTPHYEEARLRFSDEKTRHWLSDVNEYYPWLAVRQSRRMPCWRSSRVTLPLADIELFGYLLGRGARPVELGR